MKTTIDINEVVLRTAQEFAIRQKRPLDTIVEEALREKLEAAESAMRTAPYRMEVCNAGGGPLPGVNLDKTSELLDL